MGSNWVYSCLATLVFYGVTVNWLPVSAVMVSSWQMLLHTDILRCVVGKSRFECCYCICNIYYCHVVIPSEDSLWLFCSDFYVLERC